MNEWKPRRANAAEMASTAAVSEAQRLADALESHRDAGELGMHRADVLRQRIENLEAENARMRSELERPMSSEATVLVHDNARLRAEVQALRGAVPAGWKLVPTEPSDEWISRLDAQQTGELEEVDADAIRQCIVELLAAAPQPAQGEK
jgi:hypothetical protein